VRSGRWSRVSVSMSVLPSSALASTLPAANDLIVGSAAVLPFSKPHPEQSGRHGPAFYHGLRLPPVEVWEFFPSCSRISTQLPGADLLTTLCWRAKRSRLVQRLREDSGSSRASILDLNVLRRPAAWPCSTVFAGGAGPTQR